ncbi:MAG: transposase [Candidatus Cloacimonadales bacterium]|nr:transposase [Candidatus Cloacimonadales bacterium]
MYQKDNYYHIYNRGCNRLPIFFCNENYRFLIQKFIESVEKYEIEINAFCLMPNHYHLLVKQNSDILISKWLKTVFNGYVQAINKQENRKGTLFEGRANSKEIKTEEQLIHLICYIHYNPVKAGLVDRAEDWEFSDYSDWIGIRKSELFCDNLLRKYFNSQDEYRQFFENYIQTLQSVEKHQDILFDEDE